MLEYQKRFKADGDRKSPSTNRDIRAWFADCRAAGQAERGGPSRRLPIEERRSKPTGQDAATENALWCEGWGKISPVINRALYIGRIGLHSTTENYDRNRFGEMTLDTMPGDATRSDFRFSSEAE